MNHLPKKKEQKPGPQRDKAILAVIIAGCLMRIGYMLYTPCNIRTYDLFDFDSSVTGKAGYLLYLLQYGELPCTNATQWYQQPLFYILGAICARIRLIFQPEADAYALVDSSKIVSCLASCGMLFLVYKIFEQLRITKRAALFGMILVAFTPVFFLTGGRVGENALVTFFMTAALLLTLYWEENPSWKWTILLAVVYGLGMTTKISMAVPAVFTAIVFIRKMVCSKERAKTGLKLIAFGGISLPLGLWYSVRNYVLFGQKLTYVLEQEIGGPLYRGDVSWVKRLLLPDVGNLIKTPYINVLEDYNLFAYLLKSELFGEFDFDIWMGIPYMLLFFNLLLTCLALGYGIVLMVRHRQRKEYGMVAGWLLLFLAFAVISYAQYPYCCSADFRYFSLIAVFKALIIAFFLEDNSQRGRAGHILNRAVEAVCAGFGALSCIMYLLI